MYNVLLTCIIFVVCMDFILRNMKGSIEPSRVVITLSVLVCPCGFKFPSVDSPALEVLEISLCPQGENCFMKFRSLKGY